MSVYARFKRNPEGFRALVELLEATPLSRRQRMIEVGMAEDPVYTQRALECMMTFQDILALPDIELAELMAKAPPRIVAFALKGADEDTRIKFLRNSRPQIAAEIKSCLEVTIGLREVGGAQLKLVETARTLEKQGLVRTKKIPMVA